MAESVALRMRLSELRSQFFLMINHAALLDIIVKTSEVGIDKITGSVLN